MVQMGFLLFCLGLLANIKISSGPKIYTHTFIQTCIRSCAVMCMCTHTHKHLGYKYIQKISEQVQENHSFFFPSHLCLLQCFLHISLYFLSLFRYLKIQNERIGMSLWFWKKAQQINLIERRIQSNTEMI